jgi:hypothetical protein
MMRLLHQPRLVFCLLFSFSVVVLVQAIAGTVSSEDRSSRLIGWRLPSMIVLSGNFVGVGELRHMTEVELDKVDDSAEEDGTPTLLMKTVVSILSEFDSGRIEIEDGRVSLIGIAQPNKIADLKNKIQNRTPVKLQIAELKISPPDEAPFHWAAGPL